MKIKATPVGKISATAVAPNLVAQNLLNAISYA